MLGIDDSDRVSTDCPSWASSRWAMVTRVFTCSMEIISG